MAVAVRVALQNNRIRKLVFRLPGEDALEAPLQRRGLALVVHDLRETTHDEMRELSRINRRGGGGNARFHTENEGLCQHPQLCSWALARGRSHAFPYGLNSLLDTDGFEFTLAPRRENGDPLKIPSEIALWACNQSAIPRS